MLRFCFPKALKCHCRLLGFRLGWLEVSLRLDSNRFHCWFSTVLFSIENVKTFNVVLNSEIKTNAIVSSLSQISHLRHQGFVLILMLDNLSSVIQYLFNIGWNGNSSENSNKLTISFKARIQVKYAGVFLENAHHFENGFVFSLFQTEKCLQRNLLVRFSHIISSTSSECRQISTKFCLWRLFWLLLEGTVLFEPCRRAWNQLGSFLFPNS